MDKLLKIAFVVCLSVTASARLLETKPGPCPAIETITDFDAARYAGVWHEVQRFDIIFERGVKCVNYNYTLHAGRADDDVVFDLSYSRVSLANGHVSVSDGNAIATDLKRGKLSVKVTPLDPRDGYWVLETDYSSYSAVYSCTAFLGVEHLTFVWLYGRQTTLDAATLAAVRDRLAARGIDVAGLKPADQSC